MDYRTFISTEDLENNLSNPNWVIVDCRFNLAEPDWGFEMYQKSHIPGAVFADLNKDLSSPTTPITGRHPLPSPEQFVTVMQRLGVSNDNQVVVYDTTQGSFASRLWYLLKLYGHDRVAVLEGGFTHWEEENRATHSGIETRTPTTFFGRPAMDRVADADEVLRRINQPNSLIIDARSPERFRGEVEPIDPIPGRIPGSANRFHGDNLTPEGLLKPISELRKEFNELLGDHAPQDVVVYCGSGVTSCFHLVVMEHIGLIPPRLYAGSWSEWIRDPERPIEKG